MSETDAEFVERVSLDLNLSNTADILRLFALARRGADAADEIEKLRAALREIDEIGRIAAQVPGPRNKLMEICNRARAALGGGDE